VGHVLFDGDKIMPPREVLPPIMRKKLSIVPFSQQKTAGSVRLVPISS
jgi:hypothetical protein